MKVKTNLSKLISVILTLIMICASFNVFADEKVPDTVLCLQIDNPMMTVDGAEAEIDPGRATTPVIIDGRTLVPIRAIIEALGGTVGWDGEKSEVTLTYKEDVIKLVINSYNAFLNDTQSTLDVAPAIINERTMLPIRYIAESFKFDVKWDGETRTVTITNTNVSDSKIIVVGESDNAISNSDNTSSKIDEENLEVLDSHESMLEEASSDETGGDTSEEDLENEDLYYE